jgi:malonate decarboxylase epsilon subunit
VSVLFTFPGQGAQHPGMLHALPDHPETRRTLDEARIVLGRDPLELDSAQALQSTLAVQLCLLLAGVAMARVLAAHGARPQMVAGLSIGAYPAAVAAEALDFADAVRLVALRGRLMEEAYPSGYGMTALTGLLRKQLDPLIAQVHSAQRPVYLANLNAARQLVIAGSDEAMAAVGALALAAGAQRAERLAVSVPSHCELFAREAQQMAAAFREVALRRPRLVYISSSSARALFDAQRIGQDLAANMACPVLWFDTVRHAWERGARLAVEMPSGSVLTKLTAPAFEGGVAICCANNRLDSLLSLIRSAGAGQPSA